MLSKSRGCEKRIIRYFADVESVDQKELHRFHCKDKRPMCNNGFFRALENLRFYGFLEITKVDGVLTVFRTEKGHTQAVKYKASENKQLEERYGCNTPA